MRRSNVLTLTLLCLFLAGTVSAHDKKGVGKVNLTIGWGEEPAFTGSRNSVEVAVADASGAPVSRTDLPLNAEVVFGQERVTLRLDPAAGEPGKFRAWLVPTRAGTYTFRITGTINGQAIDISTTCSPRTFDCVGDATDLQFPAKDPSAGQLADGVSRALPRADRAIEQAASARSIAIAAIAIALAALAVTGVAAARWSRRG